MTDRESKALNIKPAGLILNSSSNTNTAGYRALSHHWILQTTDHSHIQEICNFYGQVTTENL